MVTTLESLMHHACRLDHSLLGSKRSDREDRSEEQGTELRSRLRCSPGPQRRRQPRAVTGAGLGEPSAAWARHVLQVLCCWIVLEFYVTGLF